MSDPKDICNGLDHCFQELPHDLFEAIDAYYHARSAIGSWVYRGPEDDAKVDRQMDELGEAEQALTVAILRYAGKLT